MLEEFKLLLQINQNIKETNLLLNELINIINKKVKK